jgi:hypothetical protein
MGRLLPIVAVVILAGSAAQAQADNISPAHEGAAPGSFQKASAPRAFYSAPEFHAAGAVAALTLLLGGVAVLKGWRRE